MLAYRETFVKRKTAVLKPQVKQTHSGGVRGEAGGSKVHGEVENNHKNHNQ